MNLYLAPLAGYTDPCYRSIVDRFQPKGMVTEMVSMRALYYKDKKTLKMLTPPQEKIQFYRFLEMTPRSWRPASGNI
ncbi:dihydrouridine synthase domain protein [Peptoniphilus sp. oral taxon 375 str. F0436]|nr:dihydrouridine synthase domain protein [Peptoniphilus sp. oral taxon 375 str. F0436]